jgi:hypothetical protein
VCSYDPKDGRKVVDGPPEVPLASVVIQKEGNKFYVIGILKVDKFGQFSDIGMTI